MKDFVTVALTIAAIFLVLKFFGKVLKIIFTVLVVAVAAFIIFGM